MSDRYTYAMQFMPAELVEKFNPDHAKQPRDEKNRFTRAHTLFGPNARFDSNRSATVGKRDFSPAERKKATAAGAAMPGGRYPIYSAKDVANAVKDYVRTGRSPAVRAHISERAKAIGAADPFSKALWSPSTDETPAGDESAVVEQPMVAKVTVEKVVQPMKDGLCWGWASVIEKDGKPIVDHQGDVVSEEELVKAAHDFITNSRTGGAMHVYDASNPKEPLVAGHVVESLVMTKALQKALSVDLGKVGWLIGYQITDPTVKKAVEEGTLKAFSIGGKGVRTPVHDDD